MNVRSARYFLKSSIGAIISGISKSSSAQRVMFNAIRLNRIQFQRLWTQDEIRFLSYAFAMRARSKSQILQDLWVCFELNEKREGFFVEFGATNGLLNSNTWLLEKVFDWKGILAEPNPFWHTELSANRAVAIEHKCVSSRSGDIVAFTTTDNSDPELSGIAGFSAGNHFAVQRKQGGSLQVETISLNDLLDKYQAPEEIDYISIETEGNELNILSAYDFKKHRFKLISIEQNAMTARDIEKILNNNGYIKVFPQFSQWDGWYVSVELRERAKPQIVAPKA
jgi:FkbM family methyltransferase